MSEAAREHLVLCWRLRGGEEGPVVGHLIGGDGTEMVRADARAVRSAFTDELRRHWISPPLEEGRLRIVRVTIRPAWREPGGTYPTPKEITLPVAAIAGESTGGGRTCFLPRLGERFFYYRPEQLDVLIEHFVRDRLREAAPPKLYRLLMAGEPWMERLLVKRQRPSRRNVPREPQPPGLMKISERVPHPKGVRRQIRAFPSAAWERGDLARAVQDRIGRERANLILVGGRGVGKSAVLHEAIRRVARGASKTPRFWRTSAGRVTAGAKYLGDWQGICEQIADELAATESALWVTDLVELVRVGGSGPEDSVAAFWIPRMDAGDVQLVGEATPRELEALRAVLPGFAARFQIIEVPEMERAAVTRVLDQFAEYARQNLGVEIDPEARRTCFSLLERFVKYERFPGKLARFLGDVVGDAKLEGLDRVTAPRARDAFIARTGLPAILVDDSLPLEREALAAWFAERVVGQRPAIDQMCRVVEVFKAGLNDPERPVATLLFAGPTGVGKTASARALAAYFFGAGQASDPLVRVDMSELQHPAQIRRLIGGGGEPGSFLQQVRAKPFCVVLLDEIEKAHPVFFDALLGVLDEGILVDSLGRVTDFRNAVVIMTSNLGSGGGSSLGFARDDGPAWAAEVRAFFRPEFFNRIDATVSFQPLSAETVEAIARRELGLIQEREGLKSRQIRPRFTERLIQRVAAEGFDPTYGARPLQRAVERLAVAPIARFLLDRPQLRGCALEVDFDGVAVVRVAR